MTYGAPVTVNASALFPHIATTIGEINSIMRDFGCTEQIQARTEIGTFTIQSMIERTADELEAIRFKAETVAREAQPTFDFRFGRLELLHG